MEPVTGCEKKASINPYLGIIVGVLGVSSSSVLVRMADAPTLIISLYRLGFSFLLMTPVTIAKHRSELKGLTARDIIITGISGVFLALHFYSWISSLSYTSVSSAAVLVNTHSVFVVIGSYVLFREWVSGRALIGAALAFAGSMCISVSDFHISSRAFLGDLLAVAGAVFIAGYFLIGRDLRQRMSMTLYTFLVYGSCTIVLLAMVLITSTPLSPGPPTNIVIFLLMAIIPTLSGHSIFNWALGYVQASVVSVAMLGEPVFATILAAIILGEYPSPVQVYGGIVIIIGLYIFIITTERSKGEWH
jgi:drug/metabolite transporter (DMT)-like permease